MKRILVLLAVSFSILGTARAESLDVLAALTARKFSALENHFNEVESQFASNQLTEQAYVSAYRPFYQEAATLTTELNAWVLAQPKSAYAHLARGIYWRKIGEARRGTKYIKDTPSEAVEYMANMHLQSQADLKQSLKLRPNWYLPVLHLMNIAQREGSGQNAKDLMSLADRIYPRNFIARARYIQTLQPRWGGSNEEMQAFVDECARQCAHPSHPRWLSALHKELQALDLPGSANSERRRALFHEALALTRDAGAAFRKSYIPLAFSLCDRAAYAQYDDCR